MDRTTSMSVTTRIINWQLGNKALSASSQIITLNIEIEGFDTSCKFNNKQSQLPNESKGSS